MVRSKENTALNGICPYFTMFPLDFPLSVLEGRARPGEWVLDPFCGRGTTNYAGRLLGLPSIGIDSSPVAVALSQAKLANTNPNEILSAVYGILDAVEIPTDVPVGEFWSLAFHHDVLEMICRLREGLLQNCETDARKALRAIILGALHGPRGKKTQSYFSNQCLRTYAPKPRYAVNYWRKHGLHPQWVDVLSIIETRAKRYYGNEETHAMGKIIQGDSRDLTVFKQLREKVRWVITSPPYYGVRTYLPDQWLRLWFLGGPPQVTYSNENQLDHNSVDSFINQLRQVWQNAGHVCLDDAWLVVRFGAISDRNIDYQKLIECSLGNTGWEIKATQSAGSALDGRRQAHSFSNPSQSASEELDIAAVWTGA